MNALKAKLDKRYMVLYAIPFIMVLGNTPLFPIFPALQRTLNLTTFQLSLLITAMSVPAAILTPIAGYMSDRFGRKTIIVPCIFLFGIGGLIIGIAVLIFENPFPWMIAGRIIQGIGAAGPIELVLALAGDLTQGEERTHLVGYLESSNGCGKLSGPLIGSALGLLGWFYPFFMYPLVTFPVATVIIFLIPGQDMSKEQISVAKYKEDLVKMVKNNSVLIPFLSGLSILFILFGIMFFLSIILENEYAMGKLGRGLVLSIPVFAIAVSSYVCGKVISIESCATSAKVGFALVAISLGGSYFFFATQWLFFLLIGGIGIGSGIGLASLNTLITSIVSGDERGIVVATYGGFRTLGAALGPMLFGILMQISYPLMFLTGAGLSIVMVIMLFLGHWEFQSKEKEG